MSSPLLFARDGRRLPFVPVTLAALAAIAAAAEDAPGRRLAYARSLYLALLELANEGRGDRVPVSRKVLGERSGCSRDLVSDLRPLLEAAGVVVVRERAHHGQTLEHEWVVVEPAAAGVPEDRTPVAGSHDPPVAARQDPRGWEPQRSLEGKEEDASLGRECVRASPRLLISGRPVKPETWQRTVDALAEFNRQTGKRQAATTGTGQPSEAAKRVYSRLAAWPKLSGEEVADVIRRTLASRWWGSDPPTIGVVFGPKVFEENLSRSPAPPATRNGNGSRSGQSQWATLRSLAKIDGATEEQAVAYANSGGRMGYDRSASTQPDGGPHA